ncbi:hypothetical protein HK098_002732 [Nowakowskiella sp. JEL0407]|nr:hypothetical protein HK098_002732 [Nowakowskiella sp. JEL0407]
MKFLFFAALISVAAAQCGKTHPYVGFSGRLTTNADGLGGLVTIIDDCTFSVSELNLNPGVPKVFWWGAPDVSVSSGFRISNQQLSSQGYTGASITFTLIGGQTWSNIPVISGYCEEFKANLAHVKLDNGPKSPTTSSPLPSPTPRAPETIFDSCISLKADVLNLYWSVRNPNIEFGLETAGMGLNSYAAFGFSNPASSTASMLNSSVTVTGNRNASSAFATQYYISTRDQCDYAQTATKGVCPTKGADSVKLMYSNYDKDKDVRFIRWSRSINSVVTGMDYDIDITKDIPAVWSFGPLSEALNVVVLYHGPNNHSQPEFKIKLGGANRTECVPLSSSNKATTPVARVEPKKITGVTQFKVTTGSNANYPNPPAWGLSYHINDYETPVLEMVRGTEYTFTISAGPTHPLYLTTSITGGKGSSNTTEKVFAGDNGVAAGTSDKPATLKFTPNKETPETIYYQCYTHQKLGWKISVVDKLTASGALRIRNIMDAGKLVPFLLFLVFLF